MRFIPDWSPALYDDVDSVVKDFEAQLASIPGSKLEHMWVVWDPSSNERFSDGPLVFCFDNQQLEIAGHRHYLAISWNTIDLSRKPAPLIIWDVADLSKEIARHELYWRDYPDLFEERMIHQTVKCLCIEAIAVQIIEIVFEMDNGLVFRVFNHQDSTGIMKYDWSDDPVKKKCFKQ